MAKNITAKDVETFIGNAVTFGWDEVTNQESKFYATLQQERGENFEFLDGETFTLVPRNLHKFHPCKFGDGYTVSMMVVINGRIRWMPVAILRRLPGLAEEIQILSKDNAIGNPLRERMTDVQRAELLYDLVGTQTVKVTVCNLHANRIERGKSPVYDSPLMEEKDRKPLRAYKFNLV